MALISWQGFDRGELAQKVGGDARQTSLEVRPHVKVSLIFFLQFYSS